MSSNEKDVQEDIPEDLGKGFEQSQTLTRWETKEKRKYR
jgi:hypothetical protein